MCSFVKGFGHKTMVYSQRNLVKSLIFSKPEPLTGLIEYDQILTYDLLEDKLLTGLINGPPTFIKNTYHLFF